MNLSQVILKSDSKPPTAAHEKTAKEFRLHKEVLNHYRAKDASEELCHKALRYSMELAVSGHAIPKTGSILDGMPVTTPDIACALADKIGFLVMPYAYLSRSFGPPHAQRCVIEELQELKFNLYVMAPVGAYDLFKHVATHDEPMFVPKDLTQAFTALGMSVPMFRSMQAQLN